MTNVTISATQSLYAIGTCYINNNQRSFTHTQTHALHFNETNTHNRMYYYKSASTLMKKMKKKFKTKK